VAERSRKWAGSQVRKAWDLDKTDVLAPAKSGLLRKLTQVLTPSPFSYRYHSQYHMLHVKRYFIETASEDHPR
jgi:hypothetical protein